MIAKRAVHPKTGRSGFTLIELLIVVIVVGILAAIGIAKYREAQRVAYRASLESDLKVLATKQELHHHVNMTYGDISDLEDYEASAGVTVAVNWIDGNGFAATATHAALPGVECGYFVGAAPTGTTGPATQEARTMCN